MHHICLVVILLMHFYGYKTSIFSICYFIISFGSYLFNRFAQISMFCVVFFLRLCIFRESEMSKFFGGQSDSESSSSEDSSSEDEVPNTKHFLWTTISVRLSICEYLSSRLQLLNRKKGFVQKIHNISWYTKRFLWSHHLLQRSFLYT